MNIVETLRAAEKRIRWYAVNAEGNSPQNPDPDDMELVEALAVVVAEKMERLLEAADNAAASLETMLAHFGHLTPAGDNASREKVLAELRAAMDAAGFVRSDE